MKNGDKPEDLSQGWWHKNKAKTLKSTGLGKALQAWTAARAKPQSLAYFKGLAGILDKVKGAVEKAKKMCDKKRHKETLAALDGYFPLVKKEIKAIEMDFKEYTKKLSIFTSSRKTLLTELDALEKRINGNYRSAEVAFNQLNDLVKKKQKADVYQRLSGFVQSSAESVDKLTKESIKKIVPWREGKLPYSQPGLDKNDKGKIGIEAMKRINPLTDRIQDKQESVKDWAADAKKLLV